MTILSKPAAEWVEEQGEPARTLSDWVRAYVREQNIEAERTEVVSLRAGLARRFAQGGSHSHLAHLVAPAAGKRQPGQSTVEPRESTEPPLAYKDPRALMITRGVLQQNGFSSPVTQLTIEQANGIMARQAPSVQKAFDGTVSVLSHELERERLKKDNEQMMREAATQRANDLAASLEEARKDKAWMQENWRRGGRTGGGRDVTE